MRNVVCKVSCWRKKTNIRPLAASAQTANKNRLDFLSPLLALVRATKTVCPFKVASFRFCPLQVIQCSHLSAL